MKTYILFFTLLLNVNSLLAQSGWQPQVSGTTQTLRSVHFITPLTGWVVGTAGTILKTSNAGDNWVSQSGGTIQDLYSVHFISSSIGWASGSGGTIIKTTNGGNNWSAQSSGTFENLNSIFFTTSSVGWTVGSNGVIYRTINGGDNWNLQPSGTTVTLNSVHPRSPTAIWAVGGGPASFDGVILKTTNQGTNWFTQQTDNPLFSVFFSNTSTGYAVGLSLQAETIFQTTNGGTNWEFAGGNFPGWLNSVHLTSGTIGWTVGLGNIYQLPSITRQEIDPVSNLYDVHAISATTAWTVGTNGTILRTTNGGTPTFNMNISGLLQGFYNPVTNKMIGDTITVTLYKIFPFPQQYQQKRAYLDSLGNCAITFNEGVDNSTQFYIIVNHRNSIETWSDTTVKFSSFALNYDFTTSASKAYGDNQILKGTKYCIYGGDVNQDYVVDLSDVTSVYNGAANFSVGYVNTDLNGDQFVDISDLLIAYNNANNFVTARSPFF